jgi:hypothetical protein
VENEMSSKRIAPEDAIVKPLPTYKLFKNLTGEKFCRLIAVSYSGSNKFTKAEWNCICDCGNMVVALSAQLISGVVRSCGCLRDETTAARNYKHGFSVRGNRDELYPLWVAIRNRCNCATNTRYHRYGGRGITISPEFYDYPGFRAYVESELGPRPSLSHSIDRIDNNKGYAPGNLRWATKTQQNRNRGDNIFVDVYGEKLLFSEAVEAYGLNRASTYRRIFVQGWTPERAFSTGYRKKNDATK